jgi:hypothetical protein
MHGGRIGEASESDLRDIRSRETILEECPHGIAVAEPLIEVAHIEMRIERDEANPGQLSQCERCWPGNRIIPAYKERERVGLRARRYGVANNWRCLFD